ncbi:DUF2169 family type VI secretion system accessory protein [Nannocystis punicea]|uniref:DUF2169 domain-containing protein n=1 Tax=Nannocystis punicea TaxID=2995304 RepID=A0ABY7H8M7_9BACT|nr:DUF2169 domain-containing protein [Nannocystis poenicansa]WAS95631.1 DUF2169 domain-containing protein [Nannocystis poenicansa]
MTQIENLSPFAATSLPSLGFDDQRLVVVVVAGRFYMPLPGSDAPDEPVLAHEQRPVPLADEYWGMPGASSLRCEGQTTHIRPGTDIYVEGLAWAPGGRPTECATVSVSVGPCHKVATVFGDRVWRSGVGSPAVSSPLPFTSVPLVYERCFGGAPGNVTGSAALASERNPVGQGLYLRAKDAIDQPLPNIEDPRQQIGSLADHPRPSGFGPISRHWRPRRDYAGTYDDAWCRMRAPLWPKDVDPRLMNAAASGLVANPALKGGEVVRLLGMHPDGAIMFSLPRLALQAKFMMRRGSSRMRMQLDGIRLEPEDGSFTLYWRAAMAVEPDPFELEHIVVRQLDAWERG